MSTPTQNYQTHSEYGFNIPQQEERQITPSFRDEYHGIIQGLNSSVQLGFTGISMLQFFITMKGIFKSVKEFLKPKIKTILNKISVRKLIKILMSFYESLFKVSSFKDGIKKLFFVSLIILFIKSLTWMINEKLQIVNKKKLNKIENPLDKFSDEFNAFNSNFYFKNN